MDLSVITSTYDNPHGLWSVCAMLRSQAVEGINLEHVIVSDGPDQRVQKIAGLFGARHADVPRTADLGCTPKDHGIAMARGRYVVFWDDDNYYPPHSIAAQLSNAWDLDLGLCRVRLPERVIPEVKSIARGQVDSACICISRGLARAASWTGGRPECGDFDFLQRVQHEAGPLRISWSPVVVAHHLSRAWRIRGRDFTGFRVPPPLSDFSPSAELR